MPEFVTQAAVPALAEAPATSVLRRTRRLIITTLVAAVVYGGLCVASRSYCPGGIRADGSFIGADGNPTDRAPSCISLTLQPNPLIFVALVVIVLWAITRVIRSGGNEAAAARYLNRAGVIVAVTAAGCVVVSVVWFGLIPITDWNGGNANYLFPFPFGSVSLDIRPLNG